jgi:DNA mismatch repair protein MutS
MGVTNYVKNDYSLFSPQIAMIVTGPNMGGKSTYMRQLAIIIILAQIGCFVPASYANVPLINKIFTRIGASDDLSMGNSTFMIEMLEVNSAIINADSNSLILLDEIGRGTSTYDGLALAQSITEYLIANNKSFLIFSTHYHQLTELANKYPVIKNIGIGVDIVDDQIKFQYRATEGISDKSYGIYVAALAKLPKSLINRAFELTKYLEDKPLSVSAPIIKTKKQNPKWVNDALDIDIDELSPIQAWHLLQQLLLQIRKQEDEQD